MQVLVVGYGSIGRRHVSNLLKLNNITKIVVFTKAKQKEAGCFDKRIQFVDSLRYFPEDVSVDEKFEFAIIANETYKHIDTAVTLAKKGIHLFIEKPLSHNLDRVETLMEIVEEQKLKVFIAYNLRFMGAIQKIKQELEDETIGKLYFAQVEVGQYLPDWRPNTDYKKSYSASSKKGGGVSLDLSHELDYMKYLFGMPLLWKTLKRKVSNLKINCDDLFEGIYQFNNGFICNVHMDYLQKVKKRIIRVVGSEGTITTNFFSKHMEIVKGDERQCLNDESLFDTENTYIDELCHFIDVIKNDTSPLVSLDDGISILEMLEDRYV